MIYVNGLTSWNEMRARETTSDSEVNCSSSQQDGLDNEPMMINIPSHAIQA